MTRRRLLQNIPMTRVTGMLVTGMLVSASSCLGSTASAVDSGVTAVAPAVTTTPSADQSVTQATEAAPADLLKVDATHRKFALSACFTQADTNNKEILVATANLPVSQAAITIAKALPNPTYNIVYGFGPAWQYIVAGNNQQFGWTEELLVAGRRTKRTQLAQANYLQAAFQVEAVRFDVHNRVRRAYAELAAAEANADLIETQRAISVSLLNVSQKRFDAGKAPGAEVLQAKLNVMQFATQRNSAIGRLLQDSAALLLLLGDTPKRVEIIDVDENVLFRMSEGKSTLVPGVERGTPPLQELLPTAWRERNDLKAAIQQAFANKKAVILAKTLKTPDPTLGVNYLFTTYKTFQTQYFNPDGTTNKSPANKVPNQPGLLLTYSQEAPIFNQYQGQVNQAKAVLDQQLKQNELSKSQIAASIITAYEALQTSRENIRKFREDLLPAGQKVAMLGRRSYELGKTDLATAVLAQQQYQQLRSAYFDSVTSYQNAWADLEKAVGVSLKL